MIYSRNNPNPPRSFFKPLSTLIKYSIIHSLYITLFSGLSVIQYSQKEFSISPRGFDISVAVLNHETSNILLKSCGLISFIAKLDMYVQFHIAAKRIYVFVSVRFPLYAARSIGISSFPGCIVLENTFAEISSSFTREPINYSYRTHEFFAVI